MKRLKKQMIDQDEFLEDSPENGLTLAESQKLANKQFEDSGKAQYIYYNKPKGSIIIQKILNLHHMMIW